ncbi:MAG: YoaK family protein [Cyclobacteriaceae bacterium]
MLRNINSSRTQSDNLRLGVLTAFAAGMVNVTSVIVFFSFTSNVTGHYAILAQEISKGNWYQAGIVFLWIFLFFFGNFMSNLMIINFTGKRKYLGHALPIVLEIICLLYTGIYLEYAYAETLIETEALVAILLFAMGLQNGLTASITNYAVKTTHLTGLTTDLGILFSLFTKKNNRSDKLLKNKAVLLLSIMSSYMLGGVFAGSTFLIFGNHVFFLICFVLSVVILYDYSINHIRAKNLLKNSLKMKFKMANKIESIEQKKSA